MYSNISSYIDTSQQIPKIIHQIWLDRDSETAPVPEKFNRFITSIKDHNPDYEYQFWNRQKVAQLFVDFPVLNRFKHFYYNVLQHHIERCDFSRYMIMYVIGGLYVDVDFEAKRSINPLVEGRSITLTVDWIHAFHVTFHVFADEPSIFNGVLASAPGHPLWFEFMNWIMYRYPKESMIFDTTGPVSFGRFMKSIGLYDETNLTEIYVSRCLIIPFGWQTQKTRNKIPEPICSETEAILSTNWFDGGDWKWKAAPKYVKFAIEQNHLVMLVIAIVLIILTIIWWLSARKRESVCELYLRDQATKSGLIATNLPVGLIAE